ncbi:MAG: spore germination protein [Clostridiales bacterium]|nr:spore germination protein [Candidatus Apopatousia equi]
MNLSSSLSKNKNLLVETLNDNIDIVKFDGKFLNTNYSIIYLQDYVNSELVGKLIIEPLLKVKRKPKKNLVDYLKKQVLLVGGNEEVKTIEDAEKCILDGNALLLLDGQKVAIKCALTKFEQRSVEEPPTSAVINGPREGFVENIKVNTVLIRKRLPTKALKIEQLQAGNYTKTKINLMYIKDIADKKIVKRIKDRLSKINIDGIIDSHYLVNYLEENKNSIFKQVGKAEKPDIVVAKMLEGRIAIIVDGSPIVLTVPFMLLEDLQNSDDYYQGSFRISFIRMIRFFGVTVSALLPGLYVAVQLYHYRIVPLKFLVTLTNSIQGLPFPPFLEMLFVIILFEILYESSLRMPKYLGIALGIVGALVLGDTAVKAGLISPPAVMIVALSGITFYTIPEQAPQLSILRMIFTLVGGTMGIFGILLGSMLLIFHLCSFNSFGVPYLAPYAPRIKDDLADGLVKKDVIGRDTRPISIPSQKKKRVEPLEKQ